MQIKIFMGYIFILMAPTFLLLSCNKKNTVDCEETVMQASVRSTGSTNSNEKLSLTPYPMEKWGKKDKSGEETEDELGQVDEVTVEPEIQEPVVEKKDPPVYPVTDILTTEKNNPSNSPEGPSFPEITTAVPSVATVSGNAALSNPPDVQTKPEEVPVAEEKAPVTPPAKEEAKKEVAEEVVDPVEQAEYERSLGKVSNVSITREIFEEDKSSVLSIIDKLAVIMKNKDYKSWLTYLEDESVKYWTTKSNLLKAQNRLPVKGLSLRNLEDYFKYVFIPSRSGRRVDEIRYDSENQVKAVQVNGESDTVYYYFKKSSNGTWKLHLPPISD